MRKVNKDTHWINNLRSYIVIVVVAAHSCSPYVMVSEKNTSGLYSDTFSMLVDSNKWIGADLFYFWVDLFTMPLMFLIGGLFVTKSLKAKGLHKFIKDKVRRIFYPFILLGIPVNIIGYYAGYVFIYDDVNFIKHIINFITVQETPVGATWFLPVFLCFNLCYVITYALFKNVYASILHFFKSKNLLILFLVVLTVSILLYTPITYKTGMHRWFGFGPFDFQINRVFGYFFYFLIGTFLGETDFIYRNKNSNNWKKCTVAAVVVYLFVLFSFETTLEGTFLIHIFKPSGYTLFLFPIGYGFISLAHLYFFKEKMNFTNKILNSLQENIYGIYIIQIVFILWIQYVLLDLNMYTGFKIVITFIGSLTLSWLVAIGLKKTSRLFKEIL